MKKRVLITAGTVYGKLDDNKLVGNRTRGIWAKNFAQFLIAAGHEVTFLAPDTMSGLGADGYVGTVERHRGFWEYQEKCLKFAATHDAAVMAAAVVNWIPHEPFVGKMSTTSLRELALPYVADRAKGDVPIPGKTVINIPFILAPRVIDKMRRVNSKLTLIGCKMTSGATYDVTIEAAYKTLVAAKCHAVVANDLDALAVKRLLYPDRARFAYDLHREDHPRSFFQALQKIIEDEHFQTIADNLMVPIDTLARPRSIFDTTVARFRAAFTQKLAGVDRVFGSLAVRVDNNTMLASPREKGALFTSQEAVLVRRSFANQTVTTHDGTKATMNAPLLARYLNNFIGAEGVLHLHQQIPGIPTTSYAPPGTVRDTYRDMPAPSFNIDGHGCILALHVDRNGFVKLDPHVDAILGRPAAPPHIHTAAAGGDTVGRGAVCAARGIHCPARDGESYRCVYCRCALSRADAKFLDADVDTKAFIA